MKTYKKMLSVFLCIVLLVTMSAGCARQSSEKSKKNPKAHGEILLGLSFDSFVIERWVRDRDTFEANTKALGAQVNVQNANGDKELQVAQIKYLLKKGVDALVVIAADCNYSKLTEILQEAKREGVVVISYDRLIAKAESDLYLSFDNKEVGTLMAQSLIHSNPDGGEIFEIGGSPADPNVKMVKEGFDQEIKKSKLKVVYTANCKQWFAEYARGYVEEALKKYPDVKGIMCGNDDIASQVAKVLAENQLLGKVSLVGQDADLVACQRIVEKTQTMTVYKPIEEIAKAAAYFAVRLVKHQDITRDVDLDGDGKMDGYFTTQKISDGKKEVPSFIIKPKAVNRKNIDSVIIDSGFHAQEDVYLNVRK